EAGLTLLDNTLYGTTSGGSSGNGTIFSISLPASPPRLTITRAGPDVILTWPTNTPGFALQSVTNLVSAHCITRLRDPIEVTGPNTVTNPISGSQQFFRLSE